MRELTRWLQAEGRDPERYILDQLASGVSVGKVAAGIVLPRHGPISRPFLYQWRDKGGPERKEAWRLAMKASGEAHAELAGDVLDLPDGFQREELGAAKAKSEYHRWMAGLRDKSLVEPQQAAVNLNLSLGSLHLDALRQAGSMDRQQISGPPAREAIPVPEYTVEDD
jgi:hypothetical protein